MIQVSIVVTAEMSTYPVLFQVSTGVTAEGFEYPAPSQVSTVDAAEISEYSARIILTPNTFPPFKYQ